MGEYTVTDLTCAHCQQQEFLKITEKLLQCIHCKKYRFNPEHLKEGFPPPKEDEQP
jgi:hypothetical protein